MNCKNETNSFSATFWSDLRTGIRRWVEPTCMGNLRSVMAILWLSGAITEEAPYRRHATACQAEATASRRMYTGIRCPQHCRNKELQILPGNSC